jgi:two-component system cell cycle response regulator CtrA
MHVLIVLDDPNVADVLSMTLEEAGHFKTTANTIETALSELKHNRIDAILLDLNLPDGDGTRPARLIRKNNNLVPILVISGNRGIDEKITALGAGADGYLTKPSDRYELMANLDAIMRRTHSHGSATISVGNLVVDLSRNYAKVGETRLELATKEFQIIEFLALRKAAVLSKNAFLNHLYGGIDEPEPEIINVVMLKLRRKLREIRAKGLSVDKVWGQGYLLCKTRLSVAQKSRLAVTSCPSRLRLRPSNSYPVWMGLAHSLRATPSLSIS